MKRALLLLAFAVLNVATFAPAKAITTTVTFTEVSGLNSGDSLVGDEWLNRGLFLINSYYYEDALDPFDGVGISNDVYDPDGLAAVLFVKPDLSDFAPTSFVDLDFVNPFDAGFGVNAYDIGGNLVDSALTNATSGSIHLTGSIAGLLWGALDGSAGTVGVSTLTYDGPSAPIPEPASMALLGLGAAGMLLVRARRRK